MNIEAVNREYTTIVNADVKHNLLAVNNGHFEEVTRAGRVWRAIKGFVTRQNQFKDCKATDVAAAVANFAETYSNHLTRDQKEKLIKKLQELETKYTNKRHVKSWAISSAINKIKLIDAGVILQDPDALRLELQEQAKILAAKKADEIQQQIKKLKKTT